MPGGKERAIKRRIKSVNNTRQITRAMKMVSAAKLSRAEGQTRLSAPYFDTLNRLMADLAPHLSEYPHPLSTVPEPTGRSLLILLTAEKGLCGAFNANLIRAARSYIHQQKEQGREVDLITVGRKGWLFFRRRKVEIVRHYPWFSKQATYREVKPIADLARELFFSGRYERVDLIYAHFINVVKNIPTQRQLLPITEESVRPFAEADGGGLKGEVLFEPSGPEMIGTLLPRYYEAVLFRAIQETYTSEHGARMVAMDNATQAAEDMIKTLTLWFNKARQEGITNEILDIVGGAEALRKMGGGA